MSRFGGLSEERPSVFKTRSKLDESGSRRSTKCSMDIQPVAQLVEETVTEKFVDYPDYLVGANALTTLNRDSSVRFFEES
ncbi:hypothetical protein TNCV_4966811 [Trichonephila clavipes]|nr:hypothetical protein TNCV_4966811 [Trichonephila clavipes]